MESNRPSLASAAAMGAVLLACLQLAGCRGYTEPQTIKCVSTGEFGPDGCAIVRGIARNATGGALGGFLVKIDSSNAEGYSYYSSEFMTAVDGSFDLLVARLPPLLNVPPDNDVVTVDIKARSISHTAGWSKPQGRAQISLRFVDLDAIIEPIDVVVQFAIP